MESIARQLAAGFAERGHDVTVVTLVSGPAGDDADFGYRVVRRPGPVRMLREIGQAEVVLQMGVMLRSAWAVTLTRTPAVISHQTWFERRDGRLRSHEWLKRRFTARRVNVVASRALLTEPAGPAVMVPNCYDDRVFRITHQGPRARDLIFVGRLVSDKGCDLLLLALAKLKERSLAPQLTIVGDGPARPDLERMVDEYGLRRQVVFTGRQSPERVADILNEHRILVVPSRWEEPFGIVALEGLACGCAVVASDGGGLGEVVGPFGRLFTRNDAGGLSDALVHELQRAGRDAQAEALRSRHLEQYRPATMVNRYLEVLGEQLPRPVGIPEAVRNH
jgi:glycogen(starch) synthase